MKNQTLLILALLVAGCGDAEYYDERPIAIEGGEPMPDDIWYGGGEPVEIEQAEQPIYLHVPYGSELGSEGGITGPQCSAPWAGGKCLVPDSRTLNVKFLASTCSQWWQARVVEAWNQWQALIELRGFTVITTSSPKYKVNCLNLTTQGLGGFHPTQDPKQQDKHSTSLGTLVQYKEGNVHIYADFIESHGSFAGNTEARKKNFAQHLIRHELFHLSGLGHSSNTSDGMYPWSDIYNQASLQYTQQLLPSASALNALECYNESSGTEPNCDN